MTPGLPDHDHLPAELHDWGDLEAAVRSSPDDVLVAVTPAGAGARGRLDWSAPVPVAAASTPAPLGRLTRHLAVLTACQEQFVTALRDGLRVQPSRLRVVLPESEDELWEEDDDEHWSAGVG